MRQMESSFVTGESSSTIVSIQNNYATDPQLCLTFVTFLPPDIMEVIDNKLIKTLRAIEPDFYYFPAESLHITIQNVRTVHNPPRFTAQDIAIVRSLAHEMFSKEPPFTFTLRGVLSMPTSVSIIALVTHAYDRFIKDFRQRLTDTGVSDDKTYFTDEMVFANATICRYTHAPSKSFLESVSGFRDIEVATVTTTEVALITGNAVAHPSKTTVLETYRLRKD